MKETNTEKKKRGTDTGKKNKDCSDEKMKNEKSMVGTQRASGISFGNSCHTISSSVSDTDQEEIDKVFKVVFLDDILALVCSPSSTPFSNHHDTHSSSNSMLQNTQLWIQESNLRD